MLTGKQSLFVKHYLVSLNQAEAARKAGYRSPAKTGHLVFHSKHVQKVIQEEMDKRNKKLEIDADYVLRELHHLYQRVMQQVKPALNSKTGKRITDEDGNALYTFNAAAALRALELIGKHTKVDSWATSKVKLDASEDLIQRLHAGRSRTLDNLIDITPDKETNGR